MAQFTRVNGDFLPEINYDAFAYTNSGVNATSSGNVVQPQGPKLEFFTVALTDVAANGTIALQTVQTIQQLATIYVYEFTTGAPDTLAVAVYPVGAWDTTSLATAIDTATGGSSTVTGEATFNN